MPDVYRTGEAARICRTSVQTIINNCKAGRLRAYKLPGSSHRRICYADLLEFMLSSGLPLDLLEESQGVESTGVRQAVRSGGQVVVK